MGTLAQFADLYLMQLANYRWTWRWQLTAGLLAPLSFMFMLHTLLERDASAAAGLTVGAHIMAGNLVISTILTTMEHSASRFAWLKATEGLDYYATLPINRAVMIVAVIASFITLALPQLAMTLLLGRVLFDLPLSPHPLALVVIVLAAVSLASVGAVLGILAPDQSTQQVTSSLLQFAMLFLSPVLIPAERLPPLMQVTSRILPTGYAVEALRKLLVGVLDEVVLLDIAALALFSVVSLFIATRRLDWRAR